MPNLILQAEGKHNTKPTADTKSNWSPFFFFFNQESDDRWTKLLERKIHNIKIVGAFENISLMNCIKRTSAESPMAAP